MNFLLFILGFLLIFPTSIFLLFKVIKKADIADIFWGINFIVLSAFSYAIFAENMSNPGLILINGIVVLWGFRVAGYIYLKNLGKKEDKRYVRLLKDNKSDFVVYWKVFLLQSILAVGIAFPVIWMNNISPQWSESWIIAILTMFWVFGFVIESVSDLQLYKWKKEPANKGKIMDKGLRSIVRYPSYLGEIIMWWSVYGIILAGFGLEFWWLFFGPLLISYILIFVSGISMTEEHYKDRQEYQEYKSRVKALIPGVW